MCGGPAPDSGHDKGGLKVSKEGQGRASCDQEWVSLQPAVIRSGLLCPSNDQDWPSLQPASAKLEVEGLCSQEVGGREVVEEGPWLVVVLRIWEQKKTLQKSTSKAQSVSERKVWSTSGLAATGHTITSFESPMATARAQLGEHAMPCLTLPLPPQCSSNLSV